MGLVSILELTEQLYTAKMFVAVIALFNVLLNLFSMYILATGGLLLLALLASVVFVFNVLFLLVTFGHWRKKNVIKGEVL